MPSCAAFDMLDTRSPSKQLFPIPDSRFPNP
jgi:hypothetical protein